MKNVPVLVFVISCISASETKYPCHPVQFEFGINCECTEIYCDSLYVPHPKEGNQFVLITSSKDGDRFSSVFGNFAHFSKRLEWMSEKNILEIDQSVKHKRSEIIGHGGAFTGAVSYFMSRFTFKLRAKFFQSYFSPVHGIGYNLLRVPIGGTDFDLEPWTYDNVSEEDNLLTFFKELDRRDEIRNNFIRELQQYTGSDGLKVLATAWTAPLWMKSKREWSGQPDNRLIPAFYQSWAEYYAKWVDLMKNDGMSIWAISSGNEPVWASHQEDGFPSMSWDAGNQADWVVNYLVPTLIESGNSDIRITLFDDSPEKSLEYLDNMTKREPLVMEVNDFISIHGYHYNLTSPEFFNKLYEKYGKKILISEMSFGLHNERTSPGSWSTADELIQVLMESFQHDASGCIDWNMILDSAGGPSFTSGHLDAFILPNDNFTAFYKQPLYYAMAHFTKFIPPYSLRVDSILSGPNVSQLQTLAYWRRDDTISVIIYNNDKANEVFLTLVDRLKGEIKLQLKPKSLNTLIYSNQGKDYSKNKRNHLYELSANWMGRYF